MASWFSGSFKKWNKHVIIIGGVVIVGLSAYAVYRYHRRKGAKSTSNGYEDIIQTSKNGSEKRILVLGLSGAGKSSFLSHLSKIGGTRKAPEPTEGFNVMCVNSGNGLALNFWEIGGSENVRSYWSNFLKDTDVLVFVVDSADDHSLPEAILQLHKLAEDKQLINVPIVILANKQDVAAALPPEDIAEAFCVADLAKSHKVEVLPLQVPLNESQHKSVSMAKDYIVNLFSGP